MDSLVKTIPEWDEYFMSLAFLTSTRSHDPSTKVGCVVVFDDNSFVTGYNGCPSGFNDDVLATKDKYDFVRHAEENALDYAGLQRCRSNKNLTLYVTIRPCPKCALKLVHFGVKRVVYRNEYQSNVNNDRLLKSIQNRGFSGVFKKPAFKICRYAGKLLYEHQHVGICSNKQNKQ